MKRLAALTLLLVCAAAPRAGAAPARRVALVVAGDAGARSPLFDAVSRGLAGRDAVTRFVLRPDEDADPIAKGRLLADLQERDLIVPIGDAASRFVTDELGGTPIFFVGAGVVAGESLRERATGGVFSFSVSALLDAAKALKLRRLGVAYTPGYEPILDLIRTGAAARGLRVTGRRIAAPKELGPAARDLLDREQAVWVLGDPLLARGAGFEYLRERSLSRAVPLISTDPGAVARGALLGYEPPQGALAAVAVAGVSRRLDRRASSPGERLQSAPAGGTVLVNAVLARKWGLPPGPEPGWRRVR